MNNKSVLKKLEEVVTFQPYQRTIEVWADSTYRILTPDELLQLATELTKMAQEVKDNG